MKRILRNIAFALPFLGFLNAPIVFADVLNASVNQGNAGVHAIKADQSIGSIISFAVTFIIVVAFLLALLFVVIGAVQWITSGGDKTKVADARNHIVAAVIGLIIVSLSFVIINIVITALGLGSLQNLVIPTLQNFGN